jgi:hypothetical protein
MDIDPAKQAEQLQQIFFDLSAAVDNFRLDNSVGAKNQRLKDQSQALFMRGQQCTADALGAILQKIQPHLPAILGATQDAQRALATLKNVEKGFSIIDSVVTLVGSIMTGDIAKLGGDLDGLQKAIAG